VIEKNISRLAGFRGSLERGTGKGKKFLPYLGLGGRVVPLL
jgi:hypothetical protein